MIIIGHRGARGEAPENTLPGFRHARASGIRHFELDVRLSWDERPVVIHDETVDRTTSDTGEVAGLPASHLAAMDARRNGPGWPVAMGIPTLEEILVDSPDVETWQLEIKTDMPSRIRVLVQRMAELIGTLRIPGHVTLTSLDRDVLRVAREEAPALPRGYVAETIDPDPVRTALGLGCELLVSNWRITQEDLVRQAHSGNLAVSVWTVNDLVVAERMANIGVDSLITDFPTALLAHATMRGRRQDNQSACR